MTWAAMSTPLSFSRLSRLLTQVLIGQKLYPTTAAEQAAGAVVVNPQVPHHLAVGHVIPDRYKTNTTPGTTDMTAAITTAAAVAALLVPSVAIFNYGSASVGLLGGTGQPNLYAVSGVSVPTGVILQGVGGIVGVVQLAGNAGVVVDTPLYNGGQTPHYNGGLRNVAVMGTGTGTGNIGLRINNAQNFVVNTVRLFNLGGPGLQVQTQYNGATTGNAGYPQSITTTAYDVRAFQCTLAVTSSTGQFGSFDIQGTDHEFTDCETYSKATGGPGYQGGNRVGWMIRGVSGASFVRCRGDLHDVGWYFDVNSNFNVQKGCLTLSSFAQGVICYGFRNRFDIVVDTASSAGTNSYDAIEDYGVNNNWTGRVSNVQNSAIQPRYGFNAQNTVTTEPTYIDGNFRMEAWQSAPINIAAGGAVAWAIPETSVWSPLTANAAAPAITSAGATPLRNFLTGNTAATAYTDFSGGWAGQRISVLVLDNFTTFSASGNIQNKTGAAVTAINGVVYDFVKKATGAWVLLNP